MKGLCRSWQECQSAGKEKQCSLWFWGSSGPSSHQYCVSEKMSFTCWPFLLVFSPKLNSFFITNTESAVRIYLVVLGQDRQPRLPSPQTAEHHGLVMLRRDRALILLNKVLHSYTITLQSSTTLSAPLGILIFSQTVSLSSWSVCCSHTTSQMCSGEGAVGFFPFILS